MTRPFRVSVTEDFSSYQRSTDIRPRYWCWSCAQEMENPAYGNRLRAIFSNYMLFVLRSTQIYQGLLGITYTLDSSLHPAGVGRAAVCSNTCFSSYLECSPVPITFRYAKDRKRNPADGFERALQAHSSWSPLGLLGRLGRGGFVEVCL